MKRMIALRYWAVVFFVCAFAAGCSSYFDDGCVEISKADIIMTVSHETVFLRYGPDGDGPAECILVMDEDYPGEWRPLLCGEIEGFDYERGYEYSLRVRRTYVGGGHGEGASVEYQLVDVLHKEFVEE